MKKLANIDCVIAMHNPCNVLMLKDIVLLSVEYESGKTRHYFLQSDGYENVPARVFTFIQSALQYYPTNDMTVYRHGRQY